MALRDPLNLQAGSYDAAHDRRLVSALLGYARFADLTPSITLTNPAHGVCGAGHLKVTEKSGTPDMSVDVAAGATFIAGTRASDQGCYWGENDATYNVVIPTAHATNSRRDLIVARVADSAYSGADDELVVECVQGTPAGSPSDPSVPDDCIVLARVNVAALDTAITNAKIDDLRVASSVWTNPRGIIARGQSTTQVGGVGTSPFTVASASTFVAEAGRLYRVNGRCRAATASTVLNVFATLEHTSGADLDVVGVSLNNSYQATLQPSYVGELTAGTTSLRLVMNTDTGSVVSAAGSGFAAYITVEDLGGILT